MEKIFLYSIIGSFLINLLVGCESSNTDGQNEMDNYNDAREAAWNFIDEKGWNDTAKENWQNAKVTSVVSSGGYELLDLSYVGIEALAVVFEGKENAVIAPPTILMDADTNKVIGYMPSE